MDLLDRLSVYTQIKRYNKHLQSLAIDCKNISLCHYLLRQRKFEYKLRICQCTLVKTNSTPLTGEVSEFGYILNFYLFTYEIA
jgi:hypothetical protein